MAYRGRGRGRGGLGSRLAKQVPFELFPEVENLGNAASVTERIKLAVWHLKLQKYWNSFLTIWESKYTVECQESLGVNGKVAALCVGGHWFKFKSWKQPLAGMQETKGMDIERFSDRTSKRVKEKSSLAQFIRMDPVYVPAELAKGGREEKHAAKRVRWNPESDMQKLDLLEKLDQKSKGDDEKKKDGEDEDEEQEKIEEEDEEFSDDGDYNQNLYDYDDDEDDYNMNEDNNDEAMY